MKTSLKIISSCLAAAFALGACPALLSADENQVQCYHSPRYLVVGKDLQTKGGTDFLIKYKAEPDEKPACRYVVEDGDFEIKNEWAEYFAALTGNLLLLDSSTGPGPSGLTIWDLVEADLGFLSSIPGIGMKKAEKLVGEAMAFNEKGAHD